ncbi:MAG: iron dicitrate transport regulator FecR [Planctomycetaceae bacterium]|jgi:ferric-dicitrate binding protein FerR (iron transport regulator)|nr:iron dicitrate transport regulator FecR [Planctomycetaceae bacterium]
MNRDMNTLINGYLDDELTDDEQCQLSDWIKADPEHATRFAHAVMLHDRLQCELSAAAEISNVEPAPVSQAAQTRRAVPHLSRSQATMAVLAASLLVALGISYWKSRRDGPIAQQPFASASFATVAHLVDVEWADGAMLRRRERMGTQSIALSSGVIRLQFDDGVEVTIQGPARYELVAPAMTKLTAGLLTATVPPGAEGFRVDTPTAEVTDLGTAFGIHLDENGVSRVSVFDGEVQVALPESAEKKILTEGEAVRVDAGANIAKVDFDAAPFEKIWPISSGIEGSTGAFRFAPPWPRRLRFVRSDDDIFVEPEGYVTTLTETLKVNISQPGEYVSEEDLTPSELSSGETVRSFILHYYPEEPRPIRRTERIAGSITFDGPVLGLIVLHEELEASARRFSQRAAGESHERRQLELRGRLVGDTVTLSQDRRTLSLDLASPRRTSDLVRVIVDASRRPARESRRMIYVALRKCACSRGDRRFCSTDILASQG